ncbi:MAG: glycosyl hydrolase family 25 [Prevotella sp.]|nr:glycosyl hydrolase family 25 [Prevotella sp.]
MLRRHHTTYYTGLRLGAILSFCMLLMGCTINEKDIKTLQQGHTTYRGQTLNGQREGLGVLLQGDSVIYSGTWHKGMRQGRGWITDSLGRKIMGTWDHDTLVTGIRHDSTGVYQGEFNRNYLAQGHGSYRDTMGTYYEGQWKNDARTGFGFSSQHRYFRVGEWKNDVYKGERLNYTSERIYGIDLSKHQHIKGKKRYGIDWGRLRISHLGTLSKKNVSGKIDYKVSFIFIKSTEGTTVLNPYYHSDYAAARAHGYPVGTYHFFSHRTSGAEQASAFLRNSKFQKGDLPPVLDLEPLPSQVKKMGGAVAMWRRVRNWLQIVEKQTGMRPILYISQIFVNRYLDAAPDIKHNYPVWIARYGEYKPDVKLWVWQLAPDGRVSGIHGEVDINVFNGYGGEFKQWLNTVRKK